MATTERKSFTFSLKGHSTGPAANGSAASTPVAQASTAPTAAIEDELSALLEVNKAPDPLANGLSLAAQSGLPDLTQLSRPSLGLNANPSGVVGGVSFLNPQTGEPVATTPLGSAYFTSTPSHLQLSTLSPSPSTSGGAGVGLPATTKTPTPVRAQSTPATASTASTPTPSPTPTATAPPRTRSTLSSASSTTSEHNEKKRQRPPEPDTPENAAKRRLIQRVELDYVAAVQPDYRTPFIDAEDAFNRLLPFYVFDDATETKPPVDFGALSKGTQASMERLNELTSQIRTKHLALFDVEHGVVVGREEKALMQRLLYSESQEALTKEKQAFQKARAATVVATAQPIKAEPTADATHG